MTRELPALAGLGAVIHWLEELASLLAGPILTVGLGIAVLDLLTGGRLLADNPALLWLWGAAMATGLDAQLVGSAAKLGAACRRRAAWPILGYGLLVLALGFVAFQASNVFATQQAEGLSTAQALARLGMDSASWIIERSALAVALVIISGLLRYVAPAKAAATLADVAAERAQLELARELEPLRQRLRAAQVGGWRAVARIAVAGTGQADVAETMNDTTAPPARPDLALSASGEGLPDDDPGGGVSLSRPDGARTQAGSGLVPFSTVRGLRGSGRGRVRPKPVALRRRDRAAGEALRRQRRERVFAILERAPDTSAAAIARALHMRHETARALLEDWRRQRAQVAQ